VAALGAAMAAANYPVTMVRGAMYATSRAYGLDAQLLALPNYVQVGSETGDNLYIANPDFDVRYDQSFQLAKPVACVPSGSVTPEEGMAELDRIRHQQRRFPVWVTVFGYAVQSAGLALILQPTPWSLVGAATLGLLVGALSVVGRLIEAIGYMLPTICAFLVAFIVFTFNSRWHVGADSLRALAAPLAGFMQIAQLAFGILIAAQLAGIADTNLDTTEFNRLGAWAPLLGVVIYGLGAMLYFGPPTSFLPWMLLMLLTAYGGQWVGNAVLGSYASGFGGGLTLIICALAISHRPEYTADGVAGASRLLAVGAGLPGLHGGHSTPRHPQHRGVHRHADLDDVDRRRRAGRSAAMAGGDPADVVTGPASHA
jgi:uncharacterized membrane protein YjjP (DUF1212 family)